MKKQFAIFGVILALLAAGFFLPSQAFAAVDVQVNGSSQCTAEHVNYTTGSSVSCSGNTATVVGSAGTAAITGGTITGTSFTSGGIDSTPIGDSSASRAKFTDVRADTVTVPSGPNADNQYLKMQNQYFTLYAFTASTRAASGAPAGSILSIRNAVNVNDCGLAGGGSAFVVCVSDGTNWKRID